MQQYDAIDKQEALRLDQEATLLGRAPLELTATEIVDTFPGGKATVKALIADCEAFLEEYENNRTACKEFLSTKVPMWDIEFTANLIMLGRYGNAKEIADEKLARLKKLWRLYQPPKKTAGGITDADIARAKEVSPRTLLKVRSNKARCVWHSDKNPSMHVYADGHCYCFSCAAHGDVIAVYQAINGCDFITAVKCLARV